MVNEVINDSKTNFNRDQLIWLRLIIIIQLIFISILIFLLYEQFTSEPQPVYFPLKKGDQLIEGAPLEQPLLTDGELLNWVTEAMIVSFSFNYHNYSKIIDKIDEYYDSLGIASYLKLINENEKIQQVVKQKLILFGRPVAAPRIIKDGVIDNRYAWEVQLPFIFKFNNQISESTQLININILVVRVAEQVAPLGVKIVKVEVV